MNFIQTLFASSDQPGSLGSKFRAKRLEKFEELFFGQFTNESKVRILDVGGTDYFWKDSKILDLPQVEIYLLNLHQEHTTHPRITAIVGNATDMREFSNQSFDLVFSNSVIEHLYTFKNQQKMASEVLRIGKKHFIQTPNRFFPIEAHYALPFAQFLPKNLVRFLLTKTKLSRMKKWEKEQANQYLDEIRLLDEKEMRLLFPNSLMFKENVLGMTKSITAHNF